MSTEAPEKRGPESLTEGHCGSSAGSFLLRWWPVITIAGFAIVVLGLWLHDLGEDVRFERLLGPWPGVCLALGSFLVVASLALMIAASARARSLEERLANAKRMCIDRFGSRCVVCGFDFAQAYGDLADQYFIDVHQTRSFCPTDKLSDADLSEHYRPVCPNCHAVIHRRDPPYTIEEVNRMFQQSH